MREIKFRAWVSDGKGYSEMYPNVQNHIGSDFGFGHILQNTVSGLDCKVMQFTGVKDKNGVEIYEGDICRVDGLGNCEVDICKFYGSVFKKDGCESLIVDSVAEQDEFKVIGNIYENPELLKAP